MHSHRVHTVIAAGTFVTFGFASAIAVGAVPRHDSQSAKSRPAVVALSQPHSILGHRTQHATVTHVRHHGSAGKKGAAVATRHNRGERAGAVPAVATSTAARPTSATVTPPPASAPRHPHHKVVATAPTKAKKPTKSIPTKPKLAPRTTPSTSAVQAAIQGLKKYVHSFLTPTPAQVGQFGDLVCSAYDGGQTTKQIEATILKKVQSLPLTTILPGAADYVVRTAVKLYCPGYTSRLGSAAA